MRRFLKPLWEGGIRAMDDVRDSTRAAAKLCMKTLSDQVGST